MLGVSYGRGEVQAEHGPEALPFLEEGIRQPGQTPNLHPHGEVLPVKVDCALDGSGALERGLHGAEARDQLPRSFVSDAGGVPLVVLRGFEHGDPIANQLGLTHGICSIRSGGVSARLAF
jgi:hypothetical protein